jgi:hypothetical protein
MQAVETQIKALQEALRDQQGELSSLETTRLMAALDRAERNINRKPIEKTPEQK